MVNRTLEDGTLENVRGKGNEILSFFPLITLITLTTFYNCLYEIVVRNNYCKRKQKTLNNAQLQQEHHHYSLTTMAK